MKRELRERGVSGIVVIVIVTCGCQSPAMTRIATSSYVPRSILREENTPTQYAYKSSVVIICSEYGRSPRGSFA